MKNIKVQMHRTACFPKDGELCGKSLLSDGRTDQATEFSIEYSPESFGPGDITALKKLGVREEDIARYLNKIVYG